MNVCGAFYQYYNETGIKLSFLFLYITLQREECTSFKSWTGTLPSSLSGSSLFLRPSLSVGSMVIISQYITV